MRRAAFLGGLCLLIALLSAAGAAAHRHHHHHGHYGNGLRKRALHGNRKALRLLAAPATECPGTDDPDAGVPSQEAAMECMLNFARQQAGLSKLDDSRKLDTSANNKASDILRCDQFSHEACGRDFLYWFRRAGFTNARCWWAGENLAWGSGNLGSVRSIVKAWLHSPPHRANILSTQFDQFGVALRVGDLSGHGDAHVWVNHFGSHC